MEMDPELADKWKEFECELEEKDAWLVLAHLWDNDAQESCEGTFYIEVNDFNCIGLCRAIDELLYSLRIDRDAYMSMKHKLRVEKADNNHALYFYPFTLIGAKQRAAFCRRMADAC